MWCRAFALALVMVLPVGLWAGPFDDEPLTAPAPAPATTSLAEPPPPPAAPPPPTDPEDLKRQIEGTLKWKGKLVDGSDQVNLADLNNWLVHFRDMNRVDAFLTGQEKTLIDKIRLISGKIGRRLTAGEVLTISLQLNHGDVARSLVTIHNAFRQLSRGRDGIPGLVEDRGFFHTYLDPSAIGKKNPARGEDISDEWYHFFGMATMSYVGDQKSTFAACKDYAKKCKGNDSRANLSTFTGIMRSGLNPLSWLPGNGVGASVAVNDALGEQAYYGYMAAVGEYAAAHRNGSFFHDCWVNLVSWGHGFKGLEADEFSAELRGAAFGSMLAKKV